MGRQSADSPKGKSKKTAKVAKTAKASQGSQKNVKSVGTKVAKVGKATAQDKKEAQKIVVTHVDPEQRDDYPEGLPKKFLNKNTFNTYDIMHAPVEKTFRMLDEILSGKRLFTM